MSYFKRIGNTISIKSREFVKNAKAVSETNSLNNIVKSEQQKIDTNYKTMGRIYFEKFSEGPSEDFEEYVAAIKASMERIEEVSAEIAKIKKRNCCPNCGARFRMDALFCSKCGTRVREEIPETEIAKCPNCGNVLDEGALFCDCCGARTCTEAEETESAEKTETAVTAAEAGVKKEDPQSASVPEPETEVKPEPEQPEPSEKTEIAQSGKRLCPSCGTEQTDEDAAFCIDCGTKL